MPGELACKATLRRSERVCVLSVLRQIQSNDFVFFRRAQTEERIDDLEQYECAAAAENERDENCFDLDEELSRVAEQETVGSGGVDRLGGEHAGEKGSGDSTHEVHADDVK